MNSEKAKRESKKYFENSCLVCGNRKVDGCHLYPAGGRFSNLKGVKYNVVCLCRRHHHLMDWLDPNDNKSPERLPIDRIKWLFDFVLDDKYDDLFDWIRELGELYE